MANSFSNGLERKNYNKFIAQMAKNTVKKKISEIRRGGARVTDALIDDLLSKSRGTASKRNPDRSETTQMGERVLGIIEKNRPKWRNFMIELANRFDADAISVFGVNFIYGGIMTSSVGNAGWASLADLGEMDNNSLEKAVKLIEAGKNRGNMVWILRGRGLFSPEAIKLYRYNPECAFVLINTDKNGVCSVSREELPTLSTIKNIMLLLSDDMRSEKLIAEIQKYGLPYLFTASDDPVLKWGWRGSAGGARNNWYADLPKEVTRFLEDPSFPLSINSFYPLICGVEEMLSAGKSAAIPYHKT